MTGGALEAVGARDCREGERPLDHREGAPHAFARAGTLYERMGARAAVGGGAALLAVGMTMLSFLDANSTYVSLIPGMVVVGVGVGVGLFCSSITTAGVTALDPSRASLAGGILYMCQIEPAARGVPGVRVLHPDLPEVVGVNTHSLSGGSDYFSGVRNVRRRVN